VAEVVGVVFRSGIKVYHFDPAGLELSRGDRVVVQTMHGVEIGQVVEPPHTIDDTELPAPLKKVARVATTKDIESLAATDELRKQAMDACRELIATHGLDMKLVGADIGFGGEKITFSFVSEERVDFRALVGDLAKTLKMRIELRQIGAREEARMVGGLGPCGRGLCCTLFSGDDDPVSIRMAKEQNLPLNPVKISGLCGRLMCCLKYEQEQYVRFRKEAPAKGTPVSTPAGEGVVSGCNVTKDAITVRLEDGSFTDVRLCACERQADGTLVAVPEEKAPAPLSWLDSPTGIEKLTAAEREADGHAVVEAEVILGENGEPVEVVVAEGSRRSGSRHPRGRRRGRGRAQANGEAAGAAAGSAGEAAASAGGAAGEASGAAPGEGRGGGRRRGGRSRRRSDHRQEQRREGARPEGSGREGSGASSAEGRGPGQPGGSGGTGGGTGGPGGGGGRSRRRRGPRRPGDGSGGSAGGSGSGTGGGSGSGGTSSGGSGTGNSGD
jgi:cell fate regulator YaaT (PSP1 superfamily)